VSELPLQRRRTREPRVKTEIVDDLFPENSVVLTEEQLAIYRAAGKFALFIDRQSDDETYKDPTKTGPEARVGAIVRAAEDFHCHCPIPPENPGWKVGEEPVPGVPQFDFKTPECEPFWFVDGTGKRASGYIVNWRSRPELWRAWHLAIRLAEAGCKPAAFVVGEPTRFFRAEDWINIFWRALNKHKITLWVVPFGEINEYTKSAYVQYVNALSGRILEHSQAARSSYKRRGKIFNKDRSAFGVTISECRSYPYADPTEWPLLFDMCHHIASGEWPRLQDVVKGLWEDYGIKRSDTWVRLLLKDEGGVLDGFYKVYRYSYDLCERTDRSGLLSDPAVTEAGNRKYLVEVGAGERFEIRHLTDDDGVPLTEPIPPEIVEAARCQILTRRGMPQRENSRMAPRRCLTLVPMRLLRCATCGSAVQELNPLAGSKRAGWRLQCQCVLRLTQRHKITTEEANQRPEAQHRLCLQGELSAPLWEVLVTAMTEQPVPPRKEDPEREREERCWLRDKEVAEAELIQITRAFVRIADPSPVQLKVMEADQKTLTDRIATAQAQLELIAADSLDGQRKIATFAHYKKALTEWLALAPEAQTIAKKREIIEAMVKQVMVNLETGEFTVTIRTPQTVERRGSVLLGNTTNRMCPAASSDIVLFGRVKLPRPKRERRAA
jgi:hypothetical protein